MVGEWGNKGPIPFAFRQFANSKIGIYANFPHLACF